MTTTPTLDHGFADGFAERIVRGFADNVAFPACRLTATGQQV
ncbi:MAG TPA: hypothetical protein VMD59_04510 [Acidimicrobiales bacterium]|nr:hypothetical protein [Acidimicrobiales bacterium]